MSYKDTFEEREKEASENPSRNWMSLRVRLPKILTLQLESRYKYSRALPISLSFSKHVSPLNWDSSRWNILLGC